MSSSSIDLNPLVLHEQLRLENKLTSPSSKSKYFHEFQKQGRLVSPDFIRYLSVDSLTSDTEAPLPSSPKKQANPENVPESRLSRAEDWLLVGAGLVLGSLAGFYATKRFLQQGKFPNGP